MSFLDHSIRSHISTTPTYLRLLEELGILTVKDMLLYYPRNHEDLSQTKMLTEAPVNETATIMGQISSIENKRTKFGKFITMATLTDEGGNIAELVWFNQKYIKNTVPLHKDVLVTGKLRHDFGRLSIQSPIVERLQEEQLHTGRIVPIYREHGKITSKWMRQKMANIIHFAEHFSENLPFDLVQSEKLLKREKAIANVHFPESEEILDQAKERLAFEELYTIQKKVLKRREEWQSIHEEEVKHIKMDVDFTKAFFDVLPFELTKAQKLVLYEILRDMEKPLPMSRLLEGDVGSGKTVVIVAAMVNVFKNGYQSAIMAPTEVLARQHYATISHLIKQLTEHKAYDDLVSGEQKQTETALDLFSAFLHRRVPKVGILTGSVTGKERKEMLAGMEDGSIDIIVGTHALIQDNVGFHNLGFVVVDEQHRFGVEQREKLKNFGSPHMLNMSATPIPRSLALTAYGDQDLSVIDEMPPGRVPIVTKVVPERERAKMYEFIKSEVTKGRQVFVICPLIDESDVLEVKSAIKEYEFLQLDIFPDLKVGLMHGKLKPGDKSHVMNQFKNKELDILVSTSVIEVGIDVPNATMMMIEGAERFGLAQLHQFRGRVGRGDKQSYCLLFSNSKNQVSMQRLKYMEKFTDGFRLAEIDLRLRGPGEVYGIRQSGIPDLKMASLSDTEMIVRVKKAVELSNTKKVPMENSEELPEAPVV